MHTLLEILSKTEGFLAGRGVREPRLDAEHLLADLLGCRRMELYLQFDRPLEEETLARLRPRVARRGRREPLSHILGTHPFHDLSVAVGPGVLAPRPETEELADRAVAHLPSPPGRVLDLGTGSGAIALWIKTRFPGAEVLATDKSGAALAVARKNAEALGLAVEFLEADWFGGVSGAFDLVLANPPYLSEEEWRAADPEVREYEPKEALVAPENGLADLRRILASAPPFLRPGALLALETGAGQRGSLLAAAAGGFSAAWGEDDFHGRDRFVFCRR